MEATVSLSIDGTKIDPQFVYDIYLGSSINEILPTLSFKIDDVGGEYLSNLKVRIGSIVKISFDIGNPDAIVTFSEFSVIRMYDGLEYNSTSNAGFIQVECRHKWAMYSNYLGKAYSPAKLSDIIKNVCTDNKYADILAKDDNFEESDDSGTIPRYKCGMSDLEFIKNRLLPYTVINGNPGLFYLSLYGVAHLTSLSKLLSKEPEFLICPQPSKMGKIEDDIEESVNAANQGYLYYSTIKVNIGNTGVDTFKKLKRQIMVKAETSSNVQVGVTDLTRIPKEPGASAGGIILPIAKAPIDASDATSVSISKNRYLSDSFGLIINDEMEMGDLISLTIGLNSAVTFEVGDSIKLIVGSTTGENKHWLTGTWVVKSISYVCSDKGGNKVICSVEVIKPSIKCNETSTLTKDTISELFTL